MTIDLDALREALERDCCGAFYGGGFGGAMVQATEVQRDFAGEANRAGRRNGAGSEPV